MGADNEEKSEISATLMANSTIVTDSTDQCMKIGDLHHAIEAGLATADGVHAEIGQILAGLRPGRTREDDILIFEARVRLFRTSPRRRSCMNGRCSGTGRPVRLRCVSRLARNFTASTS